AARPCAPRIRPQERLSWQLPLNQQNDRRPPRSWHVSANGITRRRSLEQRENVGSSRSGRNFHVQAFVALGACLQAAGAVLREPGAWRGLVVDPKVPGRHDERLCDDAWEQLPAASWRTAPRLVGDPDVWFPPRFEEGKQCSRWTAPACGRT